jgi:ketosteroid isomerase-like protein
MDVGRETPAGVARQFWGALERRDFEVLAQLFHEDARIQMVWAGPRVLTADETMRELVRAHEETVYSADPSRLVGIDDAAALVFGSVRMPDASGGGHSLSTYVWLFTVRDGRVFRARPYRYEDEARIAYTEHGVTLGM